MTTATTIANITARARSTTRKTAPKTTPKKVNLDKLSDKELDALPLDVFVASLSPWGRKFYEASKPFKGKLKPIK